MKVVGKLDSINPVFADETDEAAVAFAKEYVKAFKGEFRSGGPTDADEVAAERFFNKYEYRVVHVGFGGCGVKEFTGEGHTFTVTTRANGRSFYGSDHQVETVR